MSEDRPEDDTRLTIGPAAAAPIAEAFRNARPNDPRFRENRNALWLHAATKGLFDPILNRVRPYTVNDLAALWGVTPGTVRNGIRAASEAEHRKPT